MYRAEVNGNIFLDTTLDDDRYTLSEAVLTKQKGGAGQFAFTVPCSNICQSDFGKITDYVDLYRDDEEDPIFFGRVYSVNQKFDNALEVICEGMLAVLCDSVFEPITHEGTLHELVELLIESHNSQVETEKQIVLGSIYVTDAACYRAYENYENTWKRFQDLVKSFGGFLYLYRLNGVMYLDWRDDTGSGSSQRVDFGENILDVQQYHKANDICTVLLPLGKANSDNVRVDISSVNSGEKRLFASSEYLNTYGYIHKAVIWDDVEVPSILKTKGIAYLNGCLAEQYTITVTAVDMADAGYDIDHFEVGQKLLVTSVPNGINGVFFDVNIQVLNLFNPKSNRLSIGTEQVTYAQMLNNTVHEMNLNLEQNYPTRSAVENATRLITGNKGGYVSLHDSDSDGQPDEILVLDTPNISQAQKLWRWNQGGFGYSRNGYNGTYGTAITMDGQIVADYISTGVLNANLIKTGKIKSDYLSLEGIVTANNGFTIDANGYVTIAQSSNSQKGSIHIGAGTYYSLYNKNGKTGPAVLMKNYASGSGGGTGNLNFFPDYYTYGTSVIYTDRDLEIQSEFKGTGGNGNAVKILMSRTSIRLMYAPLASATYSALENLAEFSTYYVNGSRNGGQMNISRIAATSISCNSLSISGTKPRIVETKDYGNRYLYAYETPTPMFADIGHGKTDENGECLIYLDDIFEETIDSNVEYSVFLQKEETGDIWVDEKTSDYFIVKGDSNIAFSWEVKAVQRDYSTYRLESDKTPEFEGDEFGGLDYIYGGELDSYISEQEDILEDDFDEMDFIEYQEYILQEEILDETA